VPVLVPTREGWIDGVIEAARLDDRVVLLDADVSRSIGSSRFRDEFPGRWFDAGISEQGMVAEAAGMALTGWIPFVESYAVFVAGRAWEHIRTTVCHMGLPVKIGGAHAGLSAGPDGATHQSLEDLALMRVLPGMTVLVPADASQTRASAIAAASVPGPCYVRFGRNPVPVLYDPGCVVVPGGADILEQGGDVVLLAAGVMVGACLEAAGRLKRDGVAATVVNAYSIKPFPAHLVSGLAMDSAGVVVACDCQEAGGLYGAACEAVCAGHGGRVVPVCIPDSFGESGEPEDLLALRGLTPDRIREAALGLLKHADDRH
jgi:transketolase